MGENKCFCLYVVRALKSDTGPNKSGGKIIASICTGGFITIGTILRGCYKVMGDLTKKNFFKKTLF